MPEPVCLYIKITETLIAPNSLRIVELQSFAASLSLIKSKLFVI